MSHRVEVFMSNAIAEKPKNMAKRARPKKPGETPPPRDRVDLRADAEWIARVERQAARLGMTLSSYIRAATTRAVEADEATEPKR
jgi:hypothetical protein